MPIVQREYTKVDFVKAFRTFGLANSAIDNMFVRMIKAESKLCDFITMSFLTTEQQDNFCNLIRERIARLR